MSDEKGVVVMAKRKNVLLILSDQQRESEHTPCIAPSFGSPLCFNK